MADLSAPSSSVSMKYGVIKADPSRVHLPADVILLVIEELSKTIEPRPNLKNVSLASRFCCLIVTPKLFWRAWMSPRQKDIETFKGICSSERCRPHVKALTYDTSVMYPEIDRTTYLRHLLWQIRHKFHIIHTYPVPRINANLKQIFSFLLEHNPHKAYDDLPGSTPDGLGRTGLRLPAVSEPYHSFDHPDWSKELLQVFDDNSLISESWCRYRQIATESILFRDSGDLARTLVNGMKVLKNLRYVQLDCKASDSNIDRFEICFTSALASIFPTGSPHDRSLGAFDLLPTYWGREANNLWTPALLPADTDAVSCEVEFRIMMQALSESGVNLLFFEMSFKRVAPPIKLFSNTHQFQSGSPLYRQVSNVLHNLTSLQLRMQMNPGDEESILEEARLDLLLNSAPNLLRLELWVRHVDEMKRTLPLRNTGLTKPTCVPKLSSLSLYGFTGSTDDLVDTLARRRLTHLDLYEFFCDQNDSDYSAPSGCEGFKEHEISRLMPIFAAIPCLGGTLAYGDDGAYLYILQYQKHNYVNRPEIYRPFAQECYPGEEDRARKFPDWVDPNTPFVVCDCSPDLRLDRDLLKYSLSQKRWFNFRY